MKYIATVLCFVAFVFGNLDFYNRLESHTESKNSQVGCAVKPDNPAAGFDVGQFGNSLHQLNTSTATTNLYNFPFNWCPEITMTFWVKPSNWSWANTAQTGGDAQNTIIYYSSGGLQFYFFPANGTGLVFDTDSFMSANDRLTSTTATIPANEWTHVALCLSVYTKYKGIWINGVEKGAKDIGAWTNTNIIVPNLGIGGAYGFNQYHIRGGVDNLKVYPYIKTNLLDDVNRERAGMNDHIGQ